MPRILWAPSHSDPGRIDLLAPRAVIEQAKGILMATYQCGPDEALDFLHRGSRASGVKAHVIAAKLVELARRELMGTDAD